MLWIPGPTEVRPELLSELSRPAIGHRTQAMRDLIARLDPGLRLAYGLADDSSAQVAVHTATATAMMESCLMGAGPRVLCVVNGAFSKRWRNVAQDLGRDVTSLEVEWGRPVDTQRLAALLESEGPFDAVTFVASETSTGTGTPPAEVRAVLQEHPDTLLFVDVVSWVAGAPVDFDAHGLDFAFAGVQKAFACPPGIVTFAASERYLAAARERTSRGSYLDPVTLFEGHAARKPAVTPCIPLYYALARQLEDITNGVTLPAAERDLRGAPAWSARFAKHERMRARTIEWARGRDLSLLPEERYGSPCVSCIQAGALDVGALVADLARRGFEISNGYGDLKGKTFRIGHMGDHTEQGLDELLAAADEVLG